ncbi:hypothetical protein ELP17_35145, partial [Klebsiella pneumoniae]|nr:hypothetical protein [Klebsiella pneumoniae]
MTLTTGKSNDDTDLNDVIISNKQQDQYAAGYQLLKEISGFHIIAEKAMKEPKVDFDIVNFKALKDWIS